MVSYPRFCSSCALIIALAACSASSEGSQPPDDANDDSYRHPPPRDAAAPHHDARVPDAAHNHPPDAGTGGGVDAGVGGGVDAGIAVDAGVGGGVDAGVSVGGVVSCYAEFAPSATCTLPTHCCFSNYSVQHTGSCETSSCSWGTIDCDGPEDCAGGQHCCGHVIIDPDEGIMGYRLACQAAACGAAPAHVELCHPASSAAATCGTGKTCVSAATADHDLPRSLSICQ